MNEVIERCNWLVNKCDDKAITPDVKDDIGYLLEEIERLNNILEEFEEELEREINIKEEDLKIEHNRYININSTLRKMLERFKELKGSDKSE